jgi:hypothetical protein
VLRRDFDTLTPADLEELVTDQVPESDAIEFKGALPAGREGDPWTRGDGRIGDRARNEILEELVAFANGHGGLLMLGVQESDDHPRRAAGLSPLPAADDLAHRFLLMSRDCIEPQVPSLTVRAVRTSDDGSGVILFRVGRSRLAPHRVTTTWQCTVRRADRCQRMTMQEIQDLTLARERSARDLQGRFQDQADAFDKLVSKGGVELPVLAARATLIPVSGDVFVEHVYGRDLGGGPTCPTVQGAFDYNRMSVSHPEPPRGRRPIVRGVAFKTSSNDGGFTRCVITDDGLVEFSLVHRVGDPSASFLFPEWALAIPLWAALTAHRFRVMAGAPSAEYGLEVEYRGERTPLGIVGFGYGGSPRSYRTESIENPLYLPRFSLVHAQEIGPLLGLVARDWFNAGGWEPPGLLTLDLARELLYPDVSGV